MTGSQGEAELFEERAGAMGRSGQRLSRLLSELREIEAEVERLQIALYLPGLDGGSRRGIEEEIDLAADAFNHLRDAATAAYRQLILQRECCGFRRHEAVERCYPIPDLLLPAEAPMPLAES